MKKITYHITTALGLTFMVGSMTAYAAPTAGQLTKKSYAPSPIKANEGGIGSPSTGSALITPKGADSIHVRLSGVTVKYGMPYLAAKTKAIEAGITGKVVSGAQMYDAARQLETAYHQAGYVLVRVTVPPQKIKDGEQLKLTVVQGYINHIDMSGLPSGVRARLKKVLAPMLYDSQLTAKQLDRQLLLAGDTPGLLLRSTLKQGDKPSTTTLVLNGQYNVVTGSLSIDNGLGTSLGTTSATLDLQANNVFGAGETSYLSLGGSPRLDSHHIFSSDPRNQQVVGGMTVPLNTDGLWANIEGVDSKTHGNADTAASISDHFQRLSVKLGMKWLRTRNLNTSSIIAFDHIDELQKLYSGTLSQDFKQDKLRVFRFTQTGNMYNSFGGQLSGSVTASIGVDGLGARKATSDLGLSRQGAEPDFKRLALQLSYRQPLFENNFNLSLRGQAQTSFNAPLVSSEQVVVTGMDSISAYTNASLAADTGVFVRTELSLPLTIPLFGSRSSWGSAVSPYVFGAVGIAKLENPTAVEKGLTHAKAYGVGLRFGLSQVASFNSTTLRVEYARGSTTGQDDDNRFNVQLVTQF